MLDDARGSQKDEISRKLFFMEEIVRKLPSQPGLRAVGL